MPGQAATSDVAAAIFRWRGELIDAARKQNRTAFVAAAFTLADILPDKLKFRWVPYDEWRDLTKPHRYVKCGKCEATIPTTAAVTRHSSLPDADRLCMGLLEPPTLTVWPCPKCGHENRRGDRRLNFEVEPADLVGPDVHAPEPPPHHTVIDHALDWGKFWAWAALMQRLIEDRLRRFREMYSVRIGEEGGVIIEADVVDGDYGAAGAGAPDGLPPALPGGEAA